MQEKTCAFLRGKKDSLQIVIKQAAHFAKVRLPQLCDEIIESAANYTTKKEAHISETKTRMRWVCTARVDECSKREKCARGINWCGVKTGNWYLFSPCRMVSVTS